MSMDDDKILARGGTEDDIVEYAKQNGADLTHSDEVALRGKIICGFAGIGKSHLAKTVEGIVDLESTPFQKDWERYVDVALHMQKNGYTVLVSCHKELRALLRARGADYGVVVPLLEDKEVYLKRYRARGNDQKFLELFENNFEKFVSEIIAEEPDNILLNPDSYLSIPSEHETARMEEVRGKIEETLTECGVLVEGLSSNGETLLVKVRDMGKDFEYGIYDQKKLKSLLSELGKKEV